MNKKFTIRQDLGESLIELKEKDDETFICLKCSSDIKQTAPNPYVWICENCQANYMGPLFE